MRLEACIDAGVDPTQERRMRFFSDNAASACPEVMAALVDANRVDTAYDGDWLSRQLNVAFSDLFETDVEALWVSTGTSANALALAALCPPFGSIVCHRDAHIQNDECGAPEFYTHGAKLLLVDGEGAKLTPAALSSALAGVRNDVHQAQPAALSVTNATEYGLVYSPAEMAELGEFSRSRGLRLHVDGARFANAVARLGCSPADLSWRAGVDALSLGFVKNGGLSAEALILFDRGLATATHFRRKRAGHLLSKGRYLAAQLLAMLKDGVWLRNARAANDGAARLAAAAQGRLIVPVEANEIFLRLSEVDAAALRSKGFDFYDWGTGAARLVVSWDQDPADVDALAAAITAL
jgi:threonine aldolase